MMKCVSGSKPQTLQSDREADQLTMRDILADVDRWQKEDVAVALATVIQTWGSSPRRAGAKMALASDGRIIGSVSGGCVENAVYEAGVESLKTNRPQLLHFGVADETAWEVGLACGGSIDVFVKPLDRIFFQFLRAAWTDQKESVHVTVIRSSTELLGSEFLIREDGIVIGNHWNTEKISGLAKEILLQRESRCVNLDDETEIFLDFISPPSTLIGIGGVHIAIALMQLAKTLGYRTIVIDPRKAWGNRERFPNVDQLIQAWPDDAFEQIKVTLSTAIVMLTHDPKLDDPALKIALKGPAFYIGALGSKSTHGKRRDRLLNEGMDELQLSRLHAPIGLDIGAQSPEEIALAIMAEVVNAHRKQNQLSAKNEAQVVPNL
ncbi:MAG: XdhC family protein [Anaerolineales bacterium]|nr:XdhC family protein [Anaerolineales bacterium]